MPALVWVAPEGRPRHFPIYKKIISIGRAGAADVSIASSTLADFHAQIVFDGRDFSLGELDRKGPIRVNGKKKRRTKVFHNDKITLGDVELVFSIYDEP